MLVGLVVIGQLGLLAWEKYENKKERSKFINALMAKTPEQFRDLELTEKVEPIRPQVKEPEFIPEHDMTDDQFKEMIDKEVG